MLSILIPVYNYNISNLIFEIHKQAINANIKFEIICYDDNSEKHISENKSAIDSLNYSSIIISKENIGRTDARQLLSNKAAYDWLLFLDADVIPKSDNFIQHYIEKTNSIYDVIYGGFAYNKEKPSNDAILRWKYGKTFEEIDAKKRNLTPYQLIISANFFIRKSVFEEINSKINKKSYGLDNYFAALLKQNNFRVLHVNNEVYHHGLESSILYLKKVEECIITLLWLYDGKKMVEHNNKLLSVFTNVKRFKVNYLMNLFYHIFNSKIKKNLLSKNPNLFLLQLYKLSYICYEDLNKKKHV
ncbi:glycosyltransferase [Flavivirga amylovorans]|uniref:Glycosyltransferase n=1 Tax=Flavivirga amylovorans TaxID=870486 RepID=A0ABT8X5X7_9FLAO|nr:glycosyltransferase [Flavivirga amylovorans]MDO5988959.1 glycosyltransferase [Flavivirga amylovorans]